MKKIYINFLILAFFIAGNLAAQNVMTLQECKDLALKNNAKSKNSKLELKAAKQVKKAARTKYFPNISAGGFMFEAEKGLMEMESEGGNLPVYDGNPANLPYASQFAYFPSSSVAMMEKGTIGYINAVQPLFAGGRIFNGNKLASLGVEVAEYKTQLTKEEVLLKTEQSFWQIISLEQKEKTIARYEALLQRLLEQVEDAYHSGVAMRNDVLKVQLKQSEIELNKSKLQNGKKLAMRAFCQHMGILFDSTLTVTESLEITDTPVLYFKDNNEVLKQRNEYALLEKSVQAEKLQTRMKIGEYLPQVGVGAGYQYLEFDEGEGRTIGLLFGSVSIPISDWWGGSHEIQEHKIKEKIAQNNFDNNIALLNLQMEKAWQDFNNAYLQVKLNQKAKVQAEENLKINEDSYQNGLSTLSDLLEAQAMLQQAEDQLIEAQSNYLISKTKYLQVTAR